jgi:hypothetical protein
VSREARLPDLVKRWRGHPRLGDVRALVKFEGEVRPWAVARALGITPAAARNLLYVVLGEQGCKWKLLAARPEPELTGEAAVVEPDVPPRRP